MMIMKRINNIIISGMAALAAISCNVDSVDNPSSGKALSFNVVFENEVGSKSGDLELRSENGEIPIVLQRVPGTKSVQINNEGSFVSVYEGNFEVEGNEGGSNVFHADAIYNSGTGLWDLQNSTYKWKPGHVLEVVAAAADFNTSDFFDGITYNGSPSTTNFYYTLPDTPTQKDFLVGYYKGGASTGTVSLKFNHPLTSVQFKVGEMPDGATLTVNSISLVGLDKTARCIASFGSPTTYAWSNYSETVSYTKTFENAQPMTPGTPIVDGDATFIVIPRKFPHDTEAKIVVNVTEYNRTYDVYASLSDQEWKPGETNVYAISFQGSRKAVLTNGPDVNKAMKTLAGGAENIEHIVFEVESDVTSETEVQAPTQWPIYLSWDAATKTIKITTSDITISTGPNAASLFQGLTALQDISGLNLLNTRNAVDMSSMFESCYALASVDLSNFYTDNVTNMSLMFAYLKTMTSLDLSSFNTKNVLGIGGMFRGIDSANRSSLTSITFGDHFTLDNNETFAFTFARTKFTSLDLSIFKSDHLRDLEYMFEDCPFLQSVDLSGLGENADVHLVQGMLSSSAIRTINFGPTLTFERTTTTGASEFFSDSHSVTVICNETAERKLKTFGQYNASRVTFQRPE